MNSTREYRKVGGTSGLSDLSTVGVRATGCPRTTRIQTARYPSLVGIVTAMILWSPQPKAHCSAGGKVNMLRIDRLQLPVQLGEKRWARE